MALARGSGLFAHVTSVQCWSITANEYDCNFWQRPSRRQYRDRGFVSLGTAEGEVLYKIGKPDHEALVNNVKGQPEEKTCTYFPHVRDPQTLTIITLRGGVVAGIERKIAR